MAEIESTFDDGPVDYTYLEREVLREHMEGDGFISLENRSIMAAALRKRGIQQKSGMAAMVDSYGRPYDPIVDMDGF